MFQLSRASSRPHVSRPTTSLSSSRLLSTIIKHDKQKIIAKRNVMQLNHHHHHSRKISSLKSFSSSSISNQNSFQILNRSGIVQRSIGSYCASALSPTRNSLHRHFSSEPIATTTTAEEESLADVTNPSTTKPAFTKILIANRGEIALRIIRTAHSLSIPTVAIHSTIDSNSLHVQHATESVCIGPPPSIDSYLNIDAVCDAIKQTGADAVHPGYGFLSENAEFARRVKEMGVAFIGPNPDAIVAMGDKIQSKRIAREANVNVIPGFDGVLDSAEEAVKVAVEVGFPIMMKAAGGGGGKGMRICHTEQEVLDTFPLCKAEAINFFNDERIFIERFIEEPHHIEIQLLAGRKRLKKSKSIAVANPFPIMDGKEYEELEILCFPERECSIQRRNQKILEESPSVLLTPEIRAEMVKQVKSLVRKVNYTSAGTVEFLVDGSGSNFYFLEMNTRLQVEHPVTEMITGVDLVRGMIDVAAGRGIPQDYLDLVNGNDDDTEEDLEGKVVPHQGHAIEARIYAEDPLRGFLPSTGPLLQYKEPPPSIRTSSTDNSQGGECQIRVDSGVTVGQTITQYYDPLISKLVSYSPNNRQEAIEGLAKACDSYIIEGLGGGHNVNFVQDVLRLRDFQVGDTPTNFIDVHYPDGFDGVALTVEEMEEVAVIGALFGEKRRSELNYPPLSLVEDEEGGTKKEEVIVCLGGMFGKAYQVSTGEDGKMVVRSISAEEETMENDGKEEEDVELYDGTTADGEKDAKEAELMVNHVSFDPNETIAEITVNGVNRAVQVGIEDNTGLFTIKMYGAKIDVLIMSPAEYELSRHMNEPTIVDTSDLVLSPMPGTLVSYAVEEGEHVVEGQELCIVEAMKMQNILRSTRSGVIGKCVGVVGSSVRADEIILEFMTEEEEEEYQKQQMDPLD